MKKNTMMRIAACLFVAVLLTTCAISGTFAKYVTTVNSEDSARVAKWGFEPTTMDITGLFKNAYDSTVSSTVDVIAPGTTNSATFSFAYDEANGINAPEVKYTFSVDTTGSEIDADIKNNGSIQWKLDTGDYGTWDELMAAIAALSGDASGTQTYEAGTLPAAFGVNDNTHTIYWRWIFTTGVGSDTTDTAMGNADTLADVTIKITITATQVD